MSTVLTDASFCHDTGASGWAAWVRIDEKTLVKKSGIFKESPSNCIEAELWAAYNGIHIAQQNGAKKILLQTDCKTNIKKLLRDKKFKGILTCRHIKAHTNRKEARFYCNDWCDRQAKQHMRKQRKLFNGT